MSNTIQTYRPGANVCEILLGNVAGYSIYELDVNGFVTKWNDDATRTNGYQASEILGRHFSCFYHHNDRANNTPARNLEIARSTGRFEGFGWRVRQDATIFYAHVVLQALTNDDGAVCGFAKITRDCTEQHRLELQSHTGERAFHFLVQHVSDCAIYMLDVDGVVSNWNAGGQAEKDRTAEEIVGRHFSCFYTAEDQEAGTPGRALFTALLEGRYETEDWRVRKDGSRFWAHVVIDPVFDERGELFGFAVVTRDRTEAHQLAQRVDDEARQFRLLVERVTDYAIYMLDVDGTVSSWNAGAQRAKGYTAPEIIGRHFSVFYTRADRAIGLPSRGLWHAREHGRFEAQGWRVRKDRSQFWAQVTINPIYDENSTLLGYTKITRDCTEQRAAALALELTRRHLDMALDNMMQGLCLFDRNGLLLLVNRQFCYLFNLQHPPAAGTSLPVLLRRIARQAVVPGNSKDGIASRLRAVMTTEGDSEHSTVVAFRDRHISFVTRALTDGGWVSTFEDVTQRRATEMQARHLAYHDPLTSLPNRAAFHETLQRLLEDSSSGRQFALLYLDLDRFKSVNDTHGHHTGDEVLKAVASSLSDTLRKPDQVARLGGDEFTILQHDAQNINDSITLAERCIEVLSTPFICGDRTIAIGVSIGIAQLPCGVISPEVALQRADLALYAAKRGGRNCYRIYEHSLYDPVRERNELKVDLDSALAKSELRLHYQPIVDAATMLPTACEGLLRWYHPRRGSIAPGEFIPIAEECGFMPELGRWVLMQACRDAALWPDTVRVNVNVTAAQITDAEFLQTVEYALHASGLAATRLELEITETTLLESTESLLAKLDMVRSLGVGIAVDDFGSGYSSLSLLQNFPFTRLKIDQRVVHNITSNIKSGAIVRAIVELCNRLEIPVTAEGVETVEQHAHLLREGCREVQGFLFAKPVSVEQLCWSMLAHSSTGVTGNF